MVAAPVPVETDRLLLRPLTHDDAAAVHAYRSDPDTVRYLPHGPLTLADVHERIDTRWATRELRVEGDALCLLAVERATGRVVGDAVLFLRSLEHRGGEVGYVLSADARGAGYAAEAAGALLRLGFGHYGMHRIVGRIDARNTASARVLERLGMRREAHFRRNELWKGEWADEVVYALLADEWERAAG